MTALPNVSVPLFDKGLATRTLRELMRGISQNVPHANDMLIDSQGRATETLREFFQGFTQLGKDEPYANDDGTATRAFWRLLWEAVR